jgi:hypothetical protein
MPMGETYYVAVPLITIYDGTASYLTADNMVVGGGQAEVRTRRTSVLSAQRRIAARPCTAPPRCPWSGAVHCLPGWSPRGGNGGVRKRRSRRHA